jgi:hypothetical protein
LDINSGATRSFDACRAIFEKAGGCKFNLETLALGGSYGGDEVFICSGAASFECECECKRDYGGCFSAAVGRGADGEIGDALCDCAEAACTQALDLFYA